MDIPPAEHIPREDHGEEKLLKRLADNEKMAELGRLSVGIIHEINTPLSVIAAASQMILRERDLPESVSEMVERIHGEVQRLSQLTRGILSFSREDIPGGEADVNLILQEAATFLKYEIQKRSVLVAFGLDPHLPPIEGNPNLLKQVFLNLIVNSLQAMENGGRLFLDSLLTDDAMVRVRIRDTGPGIPENAIDRIFDPFFTTKEPREGTGLGLFITRQNVEKMGGTILVESRQGEGTCFTLLFPPATP
jgi:two-component system NtrC family sensor kinase